MSFTHLVIGICVCIQGDNRLDQARLLGPSYKSEDSAEWQYGDIVARLERDTAHNASISFTGSRGTLTPPAHRFTDQGSAAEIAHLIANTFLAVAG